MAARHIHGRCPYAALLLASSKGRRRVDGVLVI